MNKTKVEILMNDGKKIVTDVSEYSAKDLATELNKTSSNMVDIGDCVIQRFAVVRVSPIENLQD